MPTIEAVAELARRVGRSTLDGAAIAAALSEDIDVARVLGHAELHADRYVRVPLHLTTSFEIRLLCWQPGQSSAVHGHGLANGAMRVLSGRARETRIGLPDRELVEGDVAIVDPHLVHQIANAGDTPLYTLHVYAPPLPVDQPSALDGRRVLIVGGGWSGAAVAIHLLERGDRDLRVTLVEREPALGRGVAYGTSDADHLLNVPAGRMGIDPDAPGEFVEFARARGVAANERSLLSRRLYGDYVLRRLAETVSRSPGRLRIVRDDVRGVARVGARWEVSLAGGQALPADDLVLATGHGPTTLPSALSSAGVPITLGAGGT